ncbi:FitA-like ribbon-helix-helix domain-containing protein [Lamprobacter modestohalophilus]|uniref:FitA-like ribbon-helix-helix domain-containing protein n=1 Tax=Lamprobacter modestohalophilus TaxID=1064514 RepID=UPI003D18AB37
MPALVSRNVPDAIYKQLKAAAASHRRSMTHEAIVSFQVVLGPVGSRPPPAGGHQCRAGHLAACHRGPSPPEQRCQLASAARDGELYPPFRCLPQPVRPLPLQNS